VRSQESLANRTSRGGVDIHIMTAMSLSAWCAQRWSQSSPCATGRLIFTSTQGRLPGSVRLAGQISAFRAEPQIGVIEYD